MNNYELTINDSQRSFHIQRRRKTPAKTKRADFLIAQMNGAYGMVNRAVPTKQNIPKLNLINVKPSKKPSVEKLGKK